MFQSILICFYLIGCCFEIWVVLNLKMSFFFCPLSLKMLWLRRLFVLARNAVICLALFQAFQKLVVAALVCSSKFPSFIYRFYNKFPMNFGQNRHFLSNRLLVFWFTLKSTIFWSILGGFSLISFHCLLFLPVFLVFFTPKSAIFWSILGEFLFLSSFSFFLVFFYTKIRHFSVKVRFSVRFPPILVQFSVHFPPILDGFCYRFLPFSLPVFFGIFSHQNPPFLVRFSIQFPPIVVQFSVHFPPILGGFFKPFRPNFWWF